MGVSDYTWRLIIDRLYSIILSVAAYTTNHFTDITDIRKSINRDGQSYSTAGKDAGVLEQYVRNVASSLLSSID